MYVCLTKCSVCFLLAEGLLSVSYSCNNRLSDVPYVIRKSGAPYMNVATGIGRPLVERILIKFYFEDSF